MKRNSYLDHLLIEKIPFSDKIKDIKSTLEEKVNNLDDNVRLKKDLEESVNELRKILEKVNCGKSMKTYISANN